MKIKKIIQLLLFLGLHPIVLSATLYTPHLSIQTKNGILSLPSRFDPAFHLQIKASLPSKQVQFCIQNSFDKFKKNIPQTINDFPSDLILLIKKYIHLDEEELKVAFNKKIDVINKWCNQIYNYTLGNPRNWQNILVNTLCLKKVSNDYSYDFNELFRIYVGLEGILKCISHYPEQAYEYKTQRRIHSFNGREFQRRYNKEFDKHFLYEQQFNTGINTSDSDILSDSDSESESNGSDENPYA